MAHNYAVCVAKHVCYLVLQPCGFWLLTLQLCVCVTDTVLYDYSRDVLMFAPGFALFQQALACE